MRVFYALAYIQRAIMTPTSFSSGLAAAGRDLIEITTDHHIQLNNLDMTPSFAET